MDEQGYCQVDVDHITILINGTPEILTPTLDGDEHLVQVPRIAEATLSALQRTRVLRAELEAPKPDRRRLSRCELCDERPQPKADICFVISEMQV